MTHFAKGSARLLPCLGWNPANLARLDPGRINREPVNQHNRHKGESICSFQGTNRDPGGGAVRVRRGGFMPCGGSLIVANGLARPGACAAVFNLLSVGRPGSTGGTGDRGAFSMVLLSQKKITLSSVFDKKVFRK